MSLLTVITRLRDRLYKPELDAGRARRIYTEYDIGRRYAEYHRYCQGRLGRELAREPDAALMQQGFEYFAPLNENDAAQWLGDLQQNSNSGLLKKDSKHLEGFHVSDMDWLRKLLTEVLAGQLDRRIVQYFGSEYLVHWLAFSVTRKAKEQASVSFRWHCDKGPSSHLKLIVYLNPTAEHGGNTEFIDLAGSEAVARRGYLFGRSSSRTSDIRHLSRIAGEDLAIHAKELRAGQAVLFQPARVLHRGLSPARGDRLVLTLCILPSPVHWNTALESGAMSNLAVDEKWHGNAMGILDRINI